MVTLVELFDKYGCDKGSIKHRYDRVYEPFFDERMAEPIRMLEIGVFKGNSIEAFIEYCPNLEIVGIDIFTRVNTKNIPILNHERVHPFVCNSLDKPTGAFNKLADDGFDIIMDDGLHTHEAQRITFKNYMPYLKENGVYFIEDVWAFDKMTGSEKEHPYLKEFGSAFSDEEYHKLLNAIGLYDVKYHDLREGYEPDTFILEIRRRQSLRKRFSSYFKGLLRFK